MLEENYRLKKRKQFNYIFKNGKVFFSKNLTLTTVDVKGSALKIGFSVNKKVGNAVNRNLAKRRMREAVRTMISEVKVGRYMVISAKPTILTLKFNELEKEILTLFNKSSMTKEKK